MADPVVLVGSTPVVVGSLVGGSVLVVVASVVVGGAAVVVGPVVGGAAVVVGPVTGGWVLVTPRVKNASVLVVGPALAGVAAGPPALVGLLRAPGPVAAVGVERLGVVVGARDPAGAVDTDLGAGWVGTVARAKAGTRRSGEDWGGRMAEATRAARTPLVSPTATSSSLQGHRDVGRCRGRARGRCRGRDVRRCRGAGVDIGQGSRFDFLLRPTRPTP